MPKFFSILLVAVMLFITSSFAQLNLHRVSTVVPEQVDGSQWLLYDQTAGGNINGYASQDFEAFFDIYDCQIADDFVINSYEWSINQVVVSGQYNAGGPGGPAAGFNVYFYSNSGGLPGALVYSALNQPYTYDDVSIFTINLGTVALLAPGTYWVSVQCRMDFDPYGQWYWNQVDGAYSSVAAWQNPNGGFGTPCVTWGNIQNCIAAFGTDQYFALYWGWWPVELISFKATTNGTHVDLNWATATETNNQGFEVQRSFGGEFETIAFVNGHGTTTETQVYSYTDRSVNVGSYSYRLKQVDFDGSFEYSKVVEVDVLAPVVFALDQNYPNPFNPSTKITYSIAVDSKVKLTVYNLLGETVATLINATILAGSQEVTFNGSNLNSGIYFYRLEAVGIDGSNFSQVRKMMLTK